MSEANQRVGEYILDEKVGQGAFAEVWRAHHNMWSDQLAAVKIPTDPNYVNNLRQEGVRIQRLAHHNIVRPIGFDPMANPPYLMTEFINGGSLRTLINRKKLSTVEAVNILKQVLSALQFGHEQGVVHGDIKPDNILLEESAEASEFSAPGSVKVSDFGIGLAAAATHIGDEAARSRALSGGMLAYVAPEQRDGAAPDVLSDVYAVGVMLFELLTGERPSGADMPSELNPAVPQSMDEVFRRSYARRERRFASAKDFLEALSGSTQAKTPEPMVVAPPPPPPPVAAKPFVPLPRNEPAVAPTASIAVKEEEESDSPMIGFRDDDNRPAPVEAAHDEPELLEIVEPEPEAEAIDDQPEILDESSIVSAPQETVAGETDEQERVPQPGDTQAPEQGGGRLAIAAIPRTLSRADRNAVFDEVNIKQLRTGEDLRGLMRGFYETRELDEGEINNIRLRLVKWANALVGNDADFDQQIVLSHAKARPLHQVTLISRIDKKEIESTRFLDNPAHRDIENALRAEDFRLMAHISAERFGQRLFTAVGNPSLRAMVNDMIRDCANETSGTIVRQDLLIGRANVIVVDFQFEGTRHRAYMLGYALRIVAPENPFERIREEPTKRAAGLLDSEQIRLGIKELRRGLDSKWADKASGMLNALRGKLAGAYMAEAKQMLDSFAWLESLDMTGKAGQLVPGLEPALQHAALVRKRTSLMHLLPGLVLALVFVLIAVMGVKGALDPKLPFDGKAFAKQLFSNNFLIGAAAAAIAALWSWKKLGTRMARTDIAFYHAMLLPTVLAAILALGPTRFIDWKGDIVCAVLLAVVITGDVLLFKYLRHMLIRFPTSSPIVGDEATILLRLESLLDHDWDRLRPLYLELGPLYSFAGVKTELPDMTTSFASETEPVPTKAAKPAAPAPARPGPPKPVQASAPVGDVDRLAAQVTNRINAGARALVPTAKTLITLLGEYTKSVNNQQLGMVQSNATKIEGKGKDLADKLADFDQLCRSPLTLDSSEESADLRALGERIAAKPNEPDFVVIKLLADLAKNFKVDQQTAVTEINRILPEVQEALERLKKV